MDIKRDNPDSALRCVLYSETSNAYDQQGKYHEAYGLLVKQMQLGERASFIPVLINYYTSLVSIGRSKEAKEIKTEFIQTLKEVLDAQPKECELLADDYRKKGNNLKAILFYQAAEALYTEETETDEMINCLQGCTLGMKLAVTALVKQRPDFRSIVNRDVVPAQRRVYNKLSNMLSAHNEKMVLIRSLCLHHIETTELVSEDNRVREKTLREAVAMMDQEFGENAGNYHLYSAHLNNLAVTCMTQEQPEEAITLFRRAIDCRHTAKDYDTEEEKRSDLKASQGGLQKAEEMLAFMRQA